MIKRKYMYVYCTENLVNGKKYIGQHRTDNLDDGYIGSGKIMRQAIKTYGKENFKKTILAFAESDAELNEIEARYIDQMSAVESPMYYNIMPGGLGHPGSHMSEETKAKLRESHTGKKITEETRQKLIVSHLGKTGRHHSEETKKKISESEKGKTVSLESRMKMSAARKGIPRNDLGKKVMCLETGSVYQSCAEAARLLSVSNNISRACATGKICAGYHWAYC